ncbi:hypothetical protein CERSUDRAFT_101469 [Gelatoporia subvermispora B]|uniref:Uncharacterized protein n=1 Tax=Ceriporiopsis subvermispora (strain B) TaxID=914234 RepID=M2QWN8_CERS8|nr:hypothetical protein CERSUDRAFT_101469 [Gelatoporia subvermispora B]
MEHGVHETKSERSVDNVDNKAAYLGSTSRREASRRRRRTDGRDGTPAPGPGCSSRAPDPARARTFEKATPGR